VQTEVEIVMNSATLYKFNDAGSQHATYQKDRFASVAELKEDARQFKALYERVVSVGGNITPIRKVPWPQDFVFGGEMASN
jgi:hypothetical protein